jgi:Flp pilus assembly pilin Flp
MLDGHRRHQNVTKFRARSSERGAVSVEYIVLLATCGLVISLAIVSLGPAIASAYQQNRQIVIAPVP